MAFLQSISDLKVRRRNEVDLNTGNDRYSGDGYSGITAIVEQKCQKFRDFSRKVP